MYSLSKSILDYDQLVDKLKEIVESSKGKIRKLDNCPKTNYGYEIPHYLVGNGDKHIVLIGGVHGNEIISVDFMVKVMEDIAKGGEYFSDIDFNDVTLHILPIDNPEGYIICTSVIRSKIPRDMSDKEIEDFAYLYYENFREDNVIAKEENEKGTSVSQRSIKKHQQMFKDASYLDIDPKHGALRNRVKNIMEEHDFPAGAMIDWKANGDGVEPNKSHWLYKTFLYAKDGQPTYGYNNFNTILDNVPGPMGVASCDCDKFVQTISTSCIDRLLQKLVEDKKYCGLISYHGTGGFLEYEPSFVYDESILNDYDRYIFTGINYFLASNYIEKTKSLMVMPDKEVKMMQYGARESSGKAYDDVIRLMYPAQLLVELSKVWGGNPLAPYGNISAYNTTIDCNKRALASTIKLMSKLYKFTNRDADFVYDEEKSDRLVRSYKYR